jgi:uncharacterized HAD superfamily protein
MKKPFAIDIDDVMGSLSNVMNPVLNRLFGKEIPLSGWITFNITSLYDITLDQFLGAIIEEKLLQAIIPYPGVSEALKRIKASGRNVVPVTSRGYHPDGLAITERWMNQHDLYRDDLIVVPEGLSKAQAVADRYPNGFEIMVDDYPPNLDKMRDAGLVEKTYLIDKPWNQDRLDFVWGKTRFATLVDALTYHFQREHEHEAEMSLS